MKTTIGLLSFAMVATLAAGCSNGKGKALDQARQSKPATEAANGAADLTSQDAKDFIHHVAAVDMAEIDLGKLAVDRGTAAEVKKFGQMMIGDHAASTDKLKALASDLKVEVPRELDKKHIDQRNKLSTESGADFDREYADAMIDGHKDLIEQLEPRIDKKGLEQWKADMKGRTAVSDGSVAILPDKSDNKTTMRLNQFAASMYPTVHAHLEAAKALKTSLEKRGTMEKRGTTQ